MGLPPASLIASCASHLRSRYELNRRYVEEIARASGLPTMTLPYLGSGIHGPDDLAVLAELLVGPVNGAVRMSITPEEIVDGRRIVVCVGSGGVGKTTIAAALALGGARRGRRVLVLTIDPANRLADALGVGALGNTPRAIPRKRWIAWTCPPEGGLSAMMLDMKRTFDDLVERFAEDEVARSRILENPIYQHASDALAGSAEYSAMEKVFELSEREDFDLIVLDTPPSQHALDFLEAPQRLLEFLDSRLVQLLAASRLRRRSLRLPPLPAKRPPGAQDPGAGLGDLASSRTSPSSCSPSRECPRGSGSERARSRHCCSDRRAPSSWQRVRRTNRWHMRRPSSTGSKSPVRRWRASS